MKFCKILDIKAFRIPALPSSGFPGRKGLCNTKHFVAHRSRETHLARVCSHGLCRLVCKAGGTPEANLDVTLCALGRAPALSLLGVGADRPKWCPAESKMFRHADKALAGSFHGIRVVPACVVSPGAVQVSASSLRSLRRISSHSMRRSLQNGSYGSYYLLGPALVQRATPSSPGRVVPPSPAGH